MASRDGRRTVPRPRRGGPRPGCPLDQRASRAHRSGPGGRGGVVVLHLVARSTSSRAAPGPRHAWNTARPRSAAVDGTGAPPHRDRLRRRPRCRPAAVPRRAGAARWRSAALVSDRRRVRCSARSGRRHALGDRHRPQWRVRPPRARRPGARAGEVGRCPRGVLRRTAADQPSARHRARRSLRCWRPRTVRRRIRS